MKVRPKKYKALKQVKIDMEQFAKSEDVKKLAEQIEDDRRMKAMMAAIQLSPRQRRKLLKMVQESRKCQ